jgi:hypothetical protein
MVQSLARGYDNGVYSILISIRVGSSLLCPFAQDGLPPVGMPLVIASGKSEAGQPVTTMRRTWWYVISY